jgi:hypothetical protein
MFTGIMAIFSAVFNVIAKIISYVPWWLWVCLGIFLLGGWVFHGGSCRDFACSRTPTPKPIKWAEYTVSKATTGASLECRMGIRGKRVRSINLIYIAAPANGALAEQSRVSLERLAGNFVRVPYQGLFKKNPQTKPVSDAPDKAENLVKCDDCGGIGKISDTCEINCFFCQHDSECDDCGGTGKIKLNYDVIDKCQSLITNHLGDNGCESCKDTGHPCTVIAQQLRDIIKSNPKKSHNIQCPECGGSGKHYMEPSESQLIVGMIYSSYGQCLNTEQVRLGMAKLLPEAPKDWKSFENEAQKKKLGVWK